MDKQERLKKLLELDEEAREICKPLGCKVTGCLKANGMKDCASYLSALNECLNKKKTELAPKYGLD